MAKNDPQDQKIKPTIRELAEVLLRVYENMSLEEIKKWEKKLSQSEIKTG